MVRWLLVVAVVLGGCLVNPADDPSEETLFAPSNELTGTTCAWWRAAGNAIDCNATQAGACSLGCVAFHDGSSDCCDP